MAQLQLDPSMKTHESPEISKPIIERTASGSKLNAKAPEFIPRCHQQAAVSGYMYPYLHVLGGAAGGLSRIFAGQEMLNAQSLVSKTPVSPSAVSPTSKEVLTDDLKQKIVKQVEYQFSNSNLASNDYLLKFINRDPEGYVPLSVIASMKKIKSLTNNNQILITALRSSTKLVVSDDGKKIKRRYPLTELEIEDYQSRTVVVENLPENCSHQNLEKIFGAIGSVKNVKLCHPQETNHSTVPASRCSKLDVLVSNKLHALVEFETIDQADKAVAELNDEKNWRKGLRVRALLRRSPKSSKSKKPDFAHQEVNHENETLVKPGCEIVDGCCIYEPAAEITGVDKSSKKESETKKGCRRGWTRCRSIGHCQKVNTSMVVQTSCPSQCEHKQGVHGPRTPDGTRGFTMGRGKAIEPVIDHICPENGLKSII